MSNYQNNTRLVYFYYPPFILDILLRWLFLGIYRSRVATPEETDFWLFIAEQVLVSIIVAIYIQVRLRNLKNRYTFIKEKQYEEKVSVASVAFRIAVVISVVYIIYSVISEQRFYQDFIALRKETDLFVPFMVLLGYSAFVFFLSLDSIRIDQTDKESLPDVPSTILPVGSWLNRLFVGEKMKPEISSEEELDKNTFLDEHDFHIDRNDTEIVAIEGRLRNESSRVEAYILESVMFGALAFSAFISIIASERFNWTLSERDELQETYNITAKEAELYAFQFDQAAFNKRYAELFKDSTLVFEPTLQPSKTNTRELAGTEISNFWNDLMSLLNDVLLFKLSQEDAGKKLDKLLKPSNLIMVIMIETLFCAMFFLSVIASRLRYTRMTEDIDNLVRLARAFNEKEEEVYNLVLQGLGDDRVRENLSKRLKVLEIKIARNINRAKDLIIKTRPILIYMSVFRNMGVLAFLFVLITSCLFFSKTLALIFFLFTIIAYAYESLDSWVRIKRNKGIQHHIPSID